MSLEGLFGAVDQDSEVFTVYTKIAADLVFVAFFEEQGLNQAAVSVRKLPHDAANLLLDLVERENVTNGQSGIGNVKLIVGSDLTERRTIILAHDMIANGIDEGSQPFRMIDVLVSEHAKDARECLLTDVFDIFPRVETFARLKANEFAKVRKEVLLSVEVTGAKPVYIGRIEILKLHWHDCSLPWERNFRTALFPRLPVNAPSKEKNGHSF